MSRPAVTPESLKAIVLMGNTGAGKSTLCQWIMNGGQKVKTKYAATQMQDVDGKAIVAAGGLHSVTKIDDASPETIFGNRYTLQPKTGEFEGQKVHIYDMPGFGDTADVVKVSSQIEQANAYVKPLGYVFIADENLKGTIAVLQKHVELWEALAKPVGGKASLEEHAKKFFFLLRGTPGEDSAEADDAVADFKEAVLKAGRLKFLVDLIEAGCHVMAVTAKANLNDVHNRTFLTEIFSVCKRSEQGEDVTVTTEAKTEFWEELAKEGGNHAKVLLKTKVAKVVQEQVKDYRKENEESLKQLKLLQDQSKDDKDKYTAQIKKVEAERAAFEEAVSAANERTTKAIADLEREKKKPGFLENLCWGLGAVAAGALTGGLGTVPVMSAMVARRNFS